MTATTARRLFFLGFTTALLTGLGCGGGGGVATTMPQLTCDDGGPAAANAVTMRCGGVVAGVLERVDVVLGGPAAGSTTLSGLNFDVVYDASKLDFVTVTSATSQLFPASALVAGQLANGQPGRVVVSIHQAGGVPDVTVSAGQHIALSVSFRTASGSTFGPTALQFDPAHSEATDTSATISFSSNLELARQ